ncbi:MAG: phenylalanine--tRNA ligase subunit beta, partial [Caulobacteraceae bacterium]
AAELEIAGESDGILELPDLPVGTPAATALGLEATIDFEVTPNRPDWLGVVGIARDLAAAGVGRFRDPAVAAVLGAFPCPIAVRLSAPEACPAFAGRLIRGVRNGPSPAWLQQRLTAIGLRPISALVDVTNLIAYDRARPLHVYDAVRIAGSFIEVRLGRAGETVAALDGQAYEVTPRMCVIADASGAIGLGGVMGGVSTGCSEATTEVFIESAWFDPIGTAQTGRDTGIVSDAQYRFARGVDPGSLVDGLELATRLILDLCGGEASDVIMAGSPPAPRAAIDFDPAYVERLSGLSLPPARVWSILGDLGFVANGGWVQPPSWRRDIDGRADLVEEVARIAGYDALPATPLPEIAHASGGILTPRQARMRTARRALAAAGWRETIGWSFVGRDVARLFGGGNSALVLENPISPELDCMRPSILPGLIEVAGRNARRGFPDCALFEIGPVFAGDAPADQRTAITAVLAPHGPRRWDGAAAEDVFTVKADLMALVAELGAPADSLQIMQDGASPWWRPGRSASLRLGRKTVLAEFGELHPAVLKALDVEGPIYGFELIVEAIPEPRKKAVKTRPALALSPFMPLTRDFAFIIGREIAAGELVRAALAADRDLIAGARVFDVYVGAGVAEGEKSVAVEVTLQPISATLTEAEIEALSARIVNAAGKAVGARLRT